MIASTIRSIEKNIPFRAVHASRGKVIRAEPISGLYEQWPAVTRFLDEKKSKHG